MTPIISRRAFLKTTTILAAAPLLGILARAASDAPLLAYIGTFSSPLTDVLPTQVDLPPGNGRGIHIFRVDRATGALTPHGILENGTSPSCLAINTAGTRLYSANETDRTADKSGTVTAHAIDPATGALSVLNTVPSGGAGPTYVSIHPGGKHLFVANYFGGSIAVLPILADGTLGPATFTHKDTGTLGPRKATNAPTGSFAHSGHDTPHAHMIQADPAGRYILHVQLALDQIHIWKFNPDPGTLSPHTIVQLPPGDGPRHFAFHPDGNNLYSLQEEASTIVHYHYDPAAGSLVEKATLSSLPPGYAGSSFASEILTSADGRFLYAGNRLHDSIAIFAIGENGALTYVAEEWTRGNYPRSFTFDPTGTYLHTCNQRADHVTTFRVDKATGRLAFTGQYTPVGNPSHIVFLYLAKGG